MQQYSYTTGKNATDSAMIIDAMDILYAGNIDGFCLASSDSDFTRLASRLREAGMIVIGMGKKQTPRPFVAACSQFKYIDLISEEITTIAETQKSDTTSKKSATQTQPEIRLKKSDETETTSTKDTEIKSHVRKCIDENSEEDGYTSYPKVLQRGSSSVYFPITVSSLVIPPYSSLITKKIEDMLMSDLGVLLSKKYPDFDPRNFGKKKLSDLLKEWGFETKSVRDPNNKKNPSGLIMYVK